MSFVWSNNHYIEINVNLGRLLFTAVNYFVVVVIDVCFWEKSMPRKHYGSTNDLIYVVFCFSLYSV